MTKLNLSNISNLQNESTVVTALTSNNAATIAAVENTISRDGTAPNQMQASLDMNSNTIINLPDALTEQEPATYSQLLAHIDALSNGAVIDASFLTLDNNPSITNNRILTPGLGIDFNDSGPQGTLTINVDTSDISDEVATLTNKSINLADNTLTGTVSEFNTALSDDNFATITGTETLLNKTLTSPSVITPTGIVKGDVGLGNVDNTSDIAKNAASGTLTNKTIVGSNNTISNISNSSLSTAADSTIKSNISGSTGSVSDNTISAVLDKQFGSTRGTMVFRGASGWSALTPGASGDYLKTLGVGTDPQWSTLTGGGDLLSTNNLSDLTSASTARTNLGLGSAALNSTSDFATASQGANALTAATAAEISANSGTKGITVDQAWSSAAVINLGTKTGTVTLDLNSGSSFLITLGGNITMALPSNLKSGQTFNVFFKQDATGSRTITWNSGWYFPDGIAPTIATTANSTCLVLSALVGATTDYIVGSGFKIS